MLRTAIQRNENVDIGYPKLISLLKKYSVGFQPKKSNVFDPVHIRNFLSQAPDIDFLVVKVTYWMCLI